MANYELDGDALPRSRVATEVAGARVAWTPVESPDPVVTKASNLPKSTVSAQERWLQFLFGKR